MSVRYDEHCSHATSPLTLALAVAIPGVIGGVCGALWLLAAAIGVPQRADSGTLTLPEAMAIASHADVARLLQHGADPNAPAQVRAGLVENVERVMTPLEAATASIRTGPIPLLLDAGAVLAERDYPVLWCAAAARGNRDMVHFLESRHPPGESPPDCSAVRSPW